eukprot:gene30444-37763_t
MLAMRFFAQRRQSPLAASGPVSGQGFGRQADPPASPSFRIPTVGAAMGSASSQPSQNARPAQASLGENATKGVRNSVSDVKLLQGDIAESWHENNADYATLAMHYSSID